MFLGLFDPLSDEDEYCFEPTLVLLARVHAMVGVDVSGCDPAGEEYVAAGRGDRGRATEGAGRDSGGTSESESAEAIVSEVGG